MFSRLRQFFAAPVFEDEYQTHMAGLLNSILLFILVMSIVGTAIVVPLEPDELVFNLLFGALMVGVSLALRFWVHQGRLRLVGGLLSIVLWLGFTALIYSNGGLGDPSLTGYFFIVALVVLLLGGQAAVFFSGLSLLAVLLLFYAEKQALITPQPTSLLDLITLVTTLGLTAMLLSFTVRRMRAGLEQARQSERTLTEANRELEATRALLEKRVLERTRGLERQSSQLRAVAEVGRTAVSIRELEELLLTVTALIGERFDFYHTGVFLLDEQGEHVALGATSGENGQRMLARGQSPRIAEEGVVAEALQLKEPRIARGVTVMGEGERAKSNSEAEGAASSLLRLEAALPLMVGDRLLGVLHLQSGAESAFSQDDIAVLQLLADQFAVAIENVLLSAQRQQALEAERRAYQLVSRRDWAQTAKTLSSLRYLGNAQGVAPVAGEPERAEMLRAVQQAKTIRDDKGTVVIPVEIRGQALGAVRLSKPRGAERWTEEEVGLMETLTSQLSVALESARLYQDTQRRALRERLTSTVASRMRESLDLDTVLQTAVSEMRRALGSSQVEVHLGLTELPAEKEQVAEGS